MLACVVVYVVFCVFVCICLNITHGACIDKNLYISASLNLCVFVFLCVNFCVYVNVCLLICAVCICFFGRPYTYICVLLLYLSTLNFVWVFSSFMSLCVSVYHMYYVYGHAYVCVYVSTCVCKCYYEKHII